MKKFLVSVMAAFMVLAIAGSAAAFSNGSLTAVIYNKTDNEVALDLGNVTSLDFTQQNVTLANAGSFSLSDYTAMDSFTDLRVGLYAADTTNLFNYFATTQNTAPGASLPSFLSFQNAAKNTWTGFGGASATESVEAASGTNSYWKKMNGGSTPGTYAGYNNMTPFGEAVLPEEGYVDMYLYKYQGATLYAGATTPYQASLRISTDGSIVMNAPTAVVPVPGAFVLLFSGLLGLVGIRRKA